MGSLLDLVALDLGRYHDTGLEEVERLLEADLRRDLDLGWAGLLNLVALDLGLYLRNLTE